ncbi:3-deoxy-manno-octulosonate cytidylyltransferase [Pararhizobium mangrovi]|uniref:3-deoxy-manno-octulosonate cytidylyltransferase n=1 Tax=Pararhizobium mangrovi TaxID=2590452 RepID=A0A506TWV0_9HYPH|nr:3-deoxy-manno-octulosonate cytidylyltransferase [Pararhizobium mangrovi]TPW25776.1 3-deoxy-manno-octulosonate cytidylyltransferase [Pararhizobium mangrovi]
MAPSVVVLVPARMHSTRLPGKPLAEIAGEAMIVQVARRASEAAIGRVVVATDTEAIAEIVRGAGFEAVMTRGDHASGSDRIHEALGMIEGGGEIDTVVNVQGDLPTIAPQTVRAALAPLEEPEVDIATLTTEIADDADRTASHIVKLVGSPVGPTRLRALYFTRESAPWGEGPFYHHIGLYAYRRSALARFVALPPSTLERRERLEQLRALEAGMRIDAEIVEGEPLGVDTPADLERARQILSKTGS